MSVHYHPRKANVVGDAFGKFIANLACLNLDNSAKTYLAGTKAVGYRNFHARKWRHINSSFNETNSYGQPQNQDPELQKIKMDAEKGCKTDFRVQEGALRFDSSLRIR